ncbi:putative Calcium/calmodulin-dependent protein kinase [Rhodotorula taiwanensis]|uniref:Putative Calcium/calmodulin-dependent protein kinase n=1 Tax=Rhodotorula taiwanensis TaxID=741276 RepID=A0A2S5B8A0_9BASI|nr:putative Calcium/calmodulin-dependent protein kinase [Rhodotorula taiwanensis]
MAVINKRLMAGREYMIRNEITVLKSISKGHKNIVTLWDYFETQNNVYLVTDLCVGGELFDRICAKSYFLEEDAAKLVRTVMSAVEYLHSHGIVHRDVKPENMLYRSKDEDSDLLLADFGLSKAMDEQQFSPLTNTCGTPGYMAPEIYQKLGHGKPVDIWAMGVVTYFLLCGYTPFDRENQVDEVQAICNADYAFEPAEYWTGVSDTARDFINRCLVIDQRQRMTASEALAHPWLAQPASSADAQQPDLLPALRKNFNAKRTWKRAILGVRAAGALKAGGEARRATMLSEMDLGQEQQEKMREQAHLAKRDAEEESSRLDSALVYSYN